MRSPFAPLPFLVFILALAFLLAFVQVGVLTIAFEKLGLSSDSAFLLLFGSLLGSAINLPVATMRAGPGRARPDRRRWNGLLLPQPREFTGTTVLAVNLGGAVVPVGFSVYLLHVHSIDASILALGVGLVTAVSYYTSRPVPKLGIAMPILVAPATSGVTALLLAPGDSAAFAYVCGTLGVLLGADVLRIKDIRRLGTPVASIGGAGTFDGIFVTGIVAVLLA